MPALDAGLSSTGTTTVMLPNVAPGTWYVLANADDAAGVAETLETNNVKFASVQVGPDFTVSLTVPSTAPAGSSISVTTVVRNAGAADAPGSTVYFYLSANPTFDGSDVRLDATRGVPALGPDLSNSGVTAVPLPPGTTGRWYLIAVADGAQVVIESNEANNTAARAVQIN